MQVAGIYLVAGNRVDTLHARPFVGNRVNRHHAYFFYKEILQKKILVSTPHSVVTSALQRSAARCDATVRLD